MNYDSNQNQGYEPKMSSGNNAGYYMGESNSLMNMLQTGGQPSSAGAAAFAQAMQGQRDQKRFDQISREEAKRQGRGGIFGSAVGLAGQGLGFLLGGSAGAAAGKALGTGLGQSLGAGKAKSYDTTGTVFGQQKFKDVNQASRDYSEGILNRSLLAGGKSLAASYLSPGGFKSTPPKGYLARTYGLGGDEFASNVTEQGIADNPFLSEQFDDVFEVVDGIPMDVEGNPISLLGSLKSNSPTAGTKSFYNNEMIERVSQPTIPKSNLLGKVKGYMDDLNDLGLSRMYGLGGKKFAQDVTNQGILDNASSLMGTDIDPFSFLDDVQETPSPLTPNIASGSSGSGYNQLVGNYYEDGGLINYMHGGVAHNNDYDPNDRSPAGTYGAPYTPPSNPNDPNTGGSYSAAGVLGEAGIGTTEDQLKLFQSFDPTKIQQAKTGAEQSLMSMTGGMGLSSAGGGFGAKQRAATSAIGAGQDLIGDTAEQAQRSFESQTLGTAADLVAGGAEFTPYGKEVPEIPSIDEGLITYQGQLYAWKDGRYQLFEDVAMTTVQEDAAEVTGGDSNRMDLSEIMAASDVHLKKEIALVSESSSGVNIYTFQYKDKKYGEGVYRGVMAQEVPWASVKTSDGYLAVDYSKIDVDFKRIA